MKWEDMEDDNVVPPDNAERMWEALDLRYLAVRFLVSFRNPAAVPELKVSALRGGMGQVLLSEYCTGDRNCEACLREPFCPVRQLMYAKYEIPPRFATRGDSNGYILECEDLRTRVRAGETMEFGLILYGRLIPCLPFFVQAFAGLGRRGLGRDHARYDLLRVEDSVGNLLVDVRNIPSGEEEWDPCISGEEPAGQLALRRPQVRSVREYAEYRREELLREGWEKRILFLSPVTIKYEGHFLNDFQSLPLIRALYRRIYSFDCFEGKQVPLMQWEGRLPVIVRQEAQRRYVPRYSETHGKKMTLTGIQGYAEFDEIPEELLLVLAAGEVLHIGKNTSFGFGRYLLQ